MYEVDDRDEVVLLEDLPRSSVGAPCPMVWAGEHHLLLAYYLENRPPDWDGTSVRVVDPLSSDEPVAVVVFQGAYAHSFGPPNDEAFEGHPLYERGLRPWRAFEVRHSSWIRRLERMNSLHPHHKASHFALCRHYVFAFHDTTFECVADSFTLSKHRGSVRDVLLSQVAELEY